MENAIKVLDAVSGEGEEFTGIDNLLDYKLVISGTANANIKAFFAEQTRDIAIFFLKVMCTDWNGATVALHAKSQNSDDEFSETGIVFTENKALVYSYK